MIGILRIGTITTILGNGEVRLATHRYCWSVLDYGDLRLIGPGSNNEGYVDEGM